MSASADEIPCWPEWINKSFLKIVNRIEILYPVTLGLPENPVFDEIEHNLAKILRAFNAP